MVSNTPVAEGTGTGEGAMAAP
eukprot:COSAG02_NODE_51448_length_314_cov_0.711628_1_plen_21_part_10